MPNQFNTVKNQVASNKFMLIRMVVRRRWKTLYTSGQTEFTLVSPNLYKIETDNVFAITQLTEITNVVADLTEVYTTPSSNMQFQRFPTYVLFYLTDAFTNWIVFTDSYIFLTGESYKYANEDPMALTDIVEWSPLIRKYPSIEYNLGNVFTGQLSIQASSFEIINLDNGFNQFLDYYHSFFNKEVKIWTCIDSVDNCAGLFIGVCSGFTVNEDTITISLEDNLSRLTVPAKFNDESRYTYHSLDVNQYLYPNSNGQPIKIFYGYITAYNLINDTTGTGLANAKKIDPTSLPEAVCYNYSTTISTSTNRNWALGRVSDYGLDVSGFDSISNVDNSSPNYTKFSIPTYVLFFDKSPFPKQLISALTVGDTIVVHSTYYVRILRMEEVGGYTYLYTTKNGSISNGHAFVAAGVGAVIITDGTNEYICLSGRDYSESLAITGAGFNHVTISFVSNFEANHSGLVALDPNKHQVRFRLRPSTSAERAYSHYVVESMLNSSGIETNTSFDSFVTDKPIQLLMSIPDYQESDFNKYTDYMQKILQAMGCILYLDNDLKVGIRSIATGSSLFTITSNDILENSFKINIDYRDMTTKAIIYNPTISADDTRIKGYDSGTIDLPKNALLHDVENVDRFIIPTDYYISYAFPRGKKTTYSFDLPSEYFSLLLGDTVTLSLDNLLGPVTTVKVYITGIEKSVGSVKITATDLEFYNE